MVYCNPHITGQHFIPEKYPKQPESRPCALRKLKVSFLQKLKMCMDGVSCPNTGNSQWMSQRCTKRCLSINSDDCLVVFPGGLGWAPLHGLTNHSIILVP